jgi:hypothetical protein
MQSFVRILFGATLLGAFAQPAGAGAAFSYLTPAQQKAYDCRHAESRGDFANSLPICLSAAAQYKQIGDAEKRNPWYSYEVEGYMLETAARDYAGLHRLPEALDTALKAHKLLSYVYSSYRMDPDDRKEVGGSIARVAQLVNEIRAQR